VFQAGAMLWILQHGMTTKDSYPSCWFKELSNDQEKQSGVFVFSR
jgi:hypothetical protein